MVTERGMSAGSCEGMNKAPRATSATFEGNGRAQRANNLKACTDFSQACGDFARARGELAEAVQSLCKSVW